MMDHYPEELAPEQLVVNGHEFWLIKLTTLRRRLVLRVWRCAARRRNNSLGSKCDGSGKCEESGVADASQTYTYRENTMKSGMLALLVIAVATLSGCNHFSQGDYRGIHRAGTIPCNGTPPNQPGCY